jgi:hypothetical protein
MRYLIIASLLAAALGFGCPTARAAEIYFDPSSYTSLAAAGSKDTIAPGTQITLRNWQSYKRFLPFGLQALYSGRYLWHVGSGPEYTLTVGTASHISLTRQFVLDTEKYSSQNHLEETASGGFTLRGYIAGLPFPNPGEPEKAAKILLNARNVYYCALWKSSNRSFLIDRFLNATPFRNIGVTWRLAHLSFPGKPANPPYGRNYLQSARYEIKAPIQQKYLTVIFLQPEDPAAFAESWVFVPWLRRSLRLATRDGCAPNFGDTLFDDQGNFFLVPLANFKISFLGEHKILHLTHANTDPAVRFNPDSIIVKGSVPGWPKPELGRWELREVYVIDVTPLPAMSGYCYSHKIFYIDKEGWFPEELEMYDAEGKLWKTTISAITFAGVNVEGNPVPIANHAAILDLQKTHATFNLLGDISIDNDVSPDFQDAAIAAFPGGLANIMK